MDATPLAAAADVSPALACDSPLSLDISASEKADSCSSSARARSSRRKLGFRGTVFHAERSNAICQPSAQNHAAG